MGKREFAEPDSERTFFPSLEGDYVEEETFEDDGLGEYDKIFLESIGDGELYEGKPVLSEPYAFTIDEDGEEVTKYRCQLKLIDYDEMEYLVCNINLKTCDDVQVNIHGKSTLFAFLGSIKDLEQEGWTSRNNRIKSANLKEYRDFISTLGSMTVKVIEHPPINDGGKPWYNFKVVEVNM